MAAAVAHLLSWHYGATWLRYTLQRLKQHLLLVLSCCAVLHVTMQPHGVGLPLCCHGQLFSAAAILSAAASGTDHLHCDIAL